MKALLKAEKSSEFSLSIAYLLHRGYFILDITYKRLSERFKGNLNFINNYTNFDHIFVKKTYSEGIL